MRSPFGSLSDRLRLGRAPSPSPRRWRTVVCSFAKRAAVQWRHCVALARGGSSNLSCWWASSIPGDCQEVPSPRPRSRLMAAPPRDRPLPALRAECVRGCSWPNPVLAPVPPKRSLATTTQAVTPRAREPWAHEAGCRIGRRADVAVHATSTGDIVVALSGREAYDASPAPAEAPWTTACPPAISAQTPSGLRARAQVSTPDASSARSLWASVDFGINGRARLISLQ